MSIIVPPPNTQYVNVTATSQALRRQAYRIRHAAYATDGHISPRDDGMFVDPYDDHENSETHVLHASGLAIGSVRTTVYCAQMAHAPVPSLDVFADVLWDSIDRDSRFVELTRLSIIPEAREHHPRATLALFGNSTHVADEKHCQYMVAAVREEHVRFYRHLCFELVAAPRCYPGLNFTTALMVLNYARHRAYLCAHRVFGAIFRFRRQAESELAAPCMESRQYA
jgi:hypothetical protein